MAADLKSAAFFYFWQMKETTLYFISGLGADERVFQFLKISGYQTSYIKWEDPLKKESLTDYCKRLIQQIDLSKNVVLIGVSFGGMIAQEIGRLIDCEKIIIISSIKSTAEMDINLSLIKWVGIYKIFPVKVLKWLNLLTANYYFGTESQMEKMLLKKIIKDTDGIFMKWAIDKIMNWHENAPLKNIIHIHGDKDKIFPIVKIKNPIIIKGGGHFMIVNKADIISHIIGENI